jgi:hypothetical protein
MINVHLTVCVHLISKNQSVDQTTIKKTVHYITFENSHSFSRLVFSCEKRKRERR